MAGGEEWIEETLLDIFGAARVPAPVPVPRFPRRRLLCSFRLSRGEVGGSRIVGILALIVYGNDGGDA